MDRDLAKLKAWQQRGARQWAAKRSRSPEEREAYEEAQMAAVELADGRCRADDFHHPDCPGIATVTHHVLTREHGGTDDVDNLLPVWGGLTGSDGCHGRIHSYVERARQLGYLRKPTDQPIRE